MLIGSALGAVLAWDQACTHVNPIVQTGVRAFASEGLATLSDGDVIGLDQLKARLGFDRALCGSLSC